MGWTVRGSNPGGGRDFPHPSRPALGPTQPPIQWAPGSFPGLKRPGRRADPPPPSSVLRSLKGRAVPLPTVRALVAYKGRTFTLPLTLMW